MTLTDLVDEAAIADVDPAERSPFAESSPPGVVRRKGARRAWLLLVIAFIGGVTWLVIGLVRAGGSSAPNGDAAIAAARTQALNLMTLDYRTAKTDLQRVVDGSVGTMRDSYSKALPATLATTASEKSVSKGTIRSVGLASVSKTKAEVLVAGDALVSFPKSAKAAASTIQVRYRFRLDLQLVGGSWKSSALNFAGLPAYSQVSS
jgi:Mce-associated membrane protein